MLRGFGAGSPLQASLLIKDKTGKIEEGALGNKLGCELYSGVSQHARENSDD